MGHFTIFDILQNKWLIKKNDWQQLLAAALFTMQLILLYQQCTVEKPTAMVVLSVSTQPYHKTVYSNQRCFNRTHRLMTTCYH